jgi:hypothetical protein
MLNIILPIITDNILCHILCYKLCIIIYYILLFKKCNANSLALFTALPILGALTLFEPKLSPAKKRPGDTSQNGWG